ncbi:hypothetical protein P879_06382 [Paragonimus westermani]|uniref:Uncharacterized protein n=1 Tax=Paragonimus westermani TaxID=34504 RepID=A0A8T0D5Q7_9TREM|nr:hypothetical protein P879_06382 [Paragonimus westermani]
MSLLGVCYQQGVASRFGQAYVVIGVRRLLAQLVLAAFHWLGQHLDHVERMTFYYCLDRDTVITRGKNGVTKLTKTDYNVILARQRTCDLWTLVEKHQNKPAVICQEPKVLHRSKNFFRSHLFTVADTAEPGEKNVLGKQHLSFPLRDPENVAIGIVDICTGTCVGGKSDLTVEETQYVINMMSILELIYREIVQKVGLQVDYKLEDIDGNIANILGKPEITKTADEARNVEPSILETYRPETIFPLLTQAELKTLIDKVTPEVYSELHSYVDPPPTVLRTIRMVIRLLNPQLASTIANKSWDKCKQLIASCIQKQIATFDPFATLMEEHRVELRHFVAETSANDVEKHGSYPTKLLYQWLRCCISALDMKLAYDNTY